MAEQQVRLSQENSDAVDEIKRLIAEQDGFSLSTAQVVNTLLSMGADAWRAKRTKAGKR